MTGIFQDFDPDLYNLYPRSVPNKTIKFNLKKIRNVPIALYPAIDDSLSTIESMEQLKDELGDNVKELKILKGGHLVHLIGKDMSFFSKNVIELMKRYQGIRGFKLEDIEKTIFGKIEEIQ